jgi:ATP-dependent protease Clp ATPase subunit
MFHCSFCLRTELETRQLIAPLGEDSICICDKCVERCGQIIAERRALDTEMLARRQFVAKLTEFAP